MQKKWLAFLTLLIIFLITVTSVVFAWFTLVQKTQAIFIYSATIKLNAELYDSQGAEVTTAINFSNVVPGDEFAFSLMVENYGNLDGDLIVEFMFDTNNLVLMDYFAIELVEPYELKTFNEGFTINDEVLKATFKTYNFKVIVSPTLTLEQINQADFIEISHLKITLQQQGMLNND